MVYPLLLRPVFKIGNYGGVGLMEKFGYDVEENIEQAYLLTYGIFGENTVRNGKYAGCQLGEVIEKWGSEALGNKAASNNDFPIAVKLIDTKDRLSLKVNPDINETLYIADCKPDSKIIYGINRNVTRDEFYHRIKTNTLSEICNIVSVNKGDVFNINAGCIYAIGKDITALCIKQNSDTSYRITDYGRVDINGKRLPLQTEKACEAACLTVSEAQSESEITLYPFGIVTGLCDNGNYIAEHLSLNGKAAMLEKESFISVVMLSGEAVLSYPTGNMRLFKGDSVFVPANTRITLTGKADVVTVHI